MSDVRSLKGRVALVVGADVGAGAAMSLALGARGVSVVVTGHDERKLGELVGEIVYGGGKARHVVCDREDPTWFDRGVARAVEVFGGLDLVVVNDRTPQDTSAVFEAAVPKMREGGCLIAVAEDLPESHAPDASEACEAREAGPAGVRALCLSLGHALKDRSVTCHAVTLSPLGASHPADPGERDERDVDAEHQAVVQRVLHAAGHARPPLTGVTAGG